MISQKTKNKYSYIIKALFETVFKPLGWKRNGSNFRYICGEIGKIVNVNRSWLNTDEDYWFRFDCGIYCENGYEITERDFCAERCQIKKHLNGWTIKFDTDPKEMSKTVNEYFIQELLPWFDRFNSKESMLESFTDRTTKLDEQAADFFISNGFGEKLIDVLFDENIRYKKQINRIRELYDIAILNDDNTYDIFLIVRSDKYTKDDVKAIAEYFHVNYSEAANMLKSRQVFFKQGDALTVRNILRYFMKYKVFIQTTPPFPKYDIYA